MSMYYVTGSLYTLISLTYFAHPPIPLSSGNHQFVLCIYESIFIWFICFVFRFHLEVRSCTYLSFSI